MSSADTGKASGRDSWLRRLFRRLKPDEIQVTSGGKVTAVYSDKSELRELVAIERERLEIDRERLEIDWELLNAESRERGPRNWAS